MPPTRKRSSFTAMHRMVILLLVGAAVWYVATPSRTQDKPRTREKAQPRQQVAPQPTRAPEDNLTPEQCKALREKLLLLGIDVNDYKYIQPSLRQEARKRLRAFDIKPPYKHHMLRLVNSINISKGTSNLDKKDKFTLRNVMHLIVAGVDLRESTPIAAAPLPPAPQESEAKPSISEGLRKKARKALHFKGIEPDSYDEKLRGLIGKDDATSIRLTRLLIMAGADVRTHESRYMKAAAAQPEIIDLLKKAGAEDVCKVGKVLRDLNYIGKARPNLNATAYIYLYSGTWCGLCPAYTQDVIEAYDEMRRNDVEVILLLNTVAPDAVLEYPEVRYQDIIPTVEYFPPWMEKTGWVSTDARLKELPHIQRDTTGIPAASFISGDGEIIMRSANAKNWKASLQKSGRN